MSFTATLTNGAPRCCTSKCRDCLPKSARGGEDAGEPWGYADTIQGLIAAGHRLPDIMGYTLGQVSQFLAAAERHRRTERIGDSLMLRMCQGDGNGWKAYMAGLKRGDHG